MFLLLFVSLFVCVFVFCFFKTGTAPKALASGFLFKSVYATYIYIDIYAMKICAITLAFNINKLFDNMERLYFFMLEVFQRTGAFSVFLAVDSHVALSHAWGEFE